MLVRHRLLELALERDLRDSTRNTYAGFLNRLGLLDQHVEDVDRGLVLEALWTIANPNSRRTAVVVLRSVFGWQMKIPKGVPRRYVLPDEDTLRLALMTTPYETRGLLMMYAGLRIGEACAVGPRDLTGDRLTVDKQVVYVRDTKEHRLGPVKTTVESIVIPHWLTDRVAALGDWDKPDSVRHGIIRAGSKVGIQLNPHQLRHWYGTTMLARGVPLIVVSKQMRHASITTTLNTYQQADTATSVHDAFG